LVRSLAQAKKIARKLFQKNQHLEDVLQGPVPVIVVVGAKLLSAADHLDQFYEAPFRTEIFGQKFSDIFFRTKIFRTNFFHVKTGKNLIQKLLI
jgi:hypothetical protein